MLGQGTAFNTKPWLTPNNKLYRAPKISKVKPFKGENQRSYLYKNEKQENA